MRGSIIQTIFCSKGNLICRKKINALFDKFQIFFSDYIEKVLNGLLETNFKDFSGDLSFLSES